MAMLAGAIALCASISTTSAQTVYGIQSGTSSVTLHKAALDTLGYTVVGQADTVTPVVGYDAGFSIDTTTNAEDMFMFTADPAFTPGMGIIEHVGTFNLGTALLPEGALSLGNFVIAFDQERLTAANSGFFVTDGADLDNQILFDVGNPSSNVFNGTEWHFIDSDLFLANEFATFLGQPALSGQDFGDLRIDALTLEKSGKVPEPSTALLSGLGAFVLLFRRRR